MCLQLLCWAGHSMPVTPQTNPGMRKLCFLKGIITRTSRNGHRHAAGPDVWHILPVLWAAWSSTCTFPRASMSGCGYFSDHCMTKSCTAQTMSSVGTGVPTLLIAVHRACTQKKERKINLVTEQVNSRMKNKTQCSHPKFRDPPPVGFAACFP